MVLKEIENFSLPYHTPPLRTIGVYMFVKPGVRRPGFLALLLSTNVSLCVCVCVCVCVPASEAINN